MKYDWHHCSYYCRDGGDNKDNFERDFKKLSEEGWRLCTVIYNKFEFIDAYYQREKAQT